MARRRKLPPYTSPTLAASRRMIAPGPHHEEYAIIHDLSFRAKNLASSLPYYDRKTGKPIADEVSALRAQARERIDRLPDSADAEVRMRLIRALYD